YTFEVCEFLFHFPLEWIRVPVIGGGVGVFIGVKIYLGFPLKLVACRRVGFHGEDVSSYQRVYVNKVLFSCTHGVGVLRKTFKTNGNGPLVRSERFSFGELLDDWSDVPDTLFADLLKSDVLQEALQGYAGVSTGIPVGRKGMVCAGGVVAGGFRREVANEY